MNKSAPHQEINKLAHEQKCISVLPFISVFVSAIMLQNLAFFFPGGKMVTPWQDPGLCLLVSRAGLNLKGPSCLHLFLSPELWAGTAVHITSGINRRSARHYFFHCHTELFCRPKKSEWRAPIFYVWFAMLIILGGKRVQGKIIRL